MKIKEISLKNFRGARSQISLNTNHQESVLLYGDNGAGKSSFLDALEWFITDHVSHLRVEEIKKNDGLKYNLSDDHEDSFVIIEFSKKVKNKKILKIVKNDLKSSFELRNEDHSILLEHLKNKQLWIRNNELISFILKTKKDKLADISNIIGYEEVSKINSILKQAANEIKRKIEHRDFESSISLKKQILGEQLGQIVNGEDQFFSAVNTFIKNKLSDLNCNIKDKKSLKNMIDDLKKSIDQQDVEHRQNLENLKKKGRELASNKVVFNYLKNYLTTARDIKKDAEGLKNITLIKLYREAQKIMNRYKEDFCPLCETKIERKALLDMISKKIDRMEKFSKKNESFQEIKAGTSEALRDYSQDIKQYKILINKLETKLKLIDDVQKKIEKLKSIIKVIEEKNVEEVNFQNISLPKNFLKDIIEEANIFLKKELENTSHNDNVSIVNVITSIEISMQSFKELMDLEKERDILCNQYSTLNKISSLFNTKQKEEMGIFLSEISNNLNEFYSFMNGKDQVNDIKLEPIEKQGEFSGIALKLKFQGQETPSSKQYLSESRINCLGLSLFLSSVRLFNKECKFFVLDDVISSFDKSHRIRFGQLLLEKFNNYQIFILTHEKEWFDQMYSQVKGLGWKIQEVRWNKNEGIQMRLPLVSYQEKIEDKIGRSNPNGLGNFIRKYLEETLKKICLEIEAKFSFKYDEQNEKRTLGELYEGFKKRIKDKSPSLLRQPEILRLPVGFFIENQSSHDNPYNENLSDMKSIYDDIKEFIKLFKCIDCNKFVSVNKTSSEGSSKVIKCFCGNKKISWR